MVGHVTSVVTSDSSEILPNYKYQVCVEHSLLSVLVFKIFSSSKNRDSQCCQDMSVEAQSYKYSTTLEMTF